MKKIVTLVSTAVLIAGAVACSSPSSPTASKSATAAASSTNGSQSATEDTSKIVVNDLTGVSLGAPTLTSPTDGQSFKYADQPITLTVKNAVTTGSAPTYSFQVATDSAFGSPVVSQDGVAQGANGSTSLVLAKLAGAKTYYWRARATSSGTTGLFSNPRSFAVGPEVVLQAPALASPTPGSSVSGNITLTVNNVQRSGPVTAITYRFDLSDSSSFGRVLSSTNVAEQNGSTSVTPNVVLGAGTYYWRVQASDSASGVSSPISSIGNFNYQPFDLSQATMVSSPQDFATWAETSKITSIIFTPDAFLVDFDKRDSPDRWPDTPFGDGSLEYTLGMCVNISNHWYCSAVVQFWYGRDLAASGIPANVGFEWFYDRARWGPMTGYQPQEGEIVGLFACAGNCRNNDAGDRSYVKERTNVAFVPWSNSGNGSYTFSVNGGRIQLRGRK
jgi:hypothetical protein